MKASLHVLAGGAVNSSGTPFRRDGLNYISYGSYECQAPSIRCLHSRILDLGTLGFGVEHLHESTCMRPCRCARQHLNADIERAHVLKT